MVIASNERTVLRPTTCHELKGILMNTFCKVILTLLLLSAQPILADGLLVGDVVPDFTLVNQDGEKTSLSDFKGKGIVVSFLYTRCPFPNKCPMIKKKLTSLADLSQKIGKEDQLQVMAITIDPENDTPDVLKAYAQGFDQTHDNWVFLTGSANDIARVAGGFGVLYWDEKGVINHNQKTVYIGPDGKIKVIKSGNDWRPGEFAAQIQASLE